MFIYQLPPPLILQVICSNRDSRQVVHDPVHPCSDLLGHLLLSIRRQGHKLKQQVAIQNALDRVGVEAVLGLQEAVGTRVQACRVLDTVDDLGRQQGQALTGLFRDWCDHAQAAVQGATHGQVTDPLVRAREHNLGQVDRRLDLGPDMVVTTADELLSTERLYIYNIKEVIGLEIEVSRFSQCHKIEKPRRRESPY